MINNDDSNPRREFLGKLAVGAAAIGLAGMASPFTLNAQGKAPAPKPSASEFEAWLGKIKGKHRQVFDTPESKTGFVFYWARVFYMTNEAVGAKADDVTPVIVLRHEAFPYGLGSDLWAKYAFGEAFKITDEAAKAPAVRNPFYKPKEGELLLPGVDIESLLKSGALIGVCDMAMTFYSKFVFGPKMKMDGDEVKKEWVAGVLPGIQIVPSGVLAVNRTQEHKCTYCIGA